MIILNCPKCSEAVTMPAGLRPTARVRCPLCQEEYVLADALGKLPPALIPLDQPVEEEEPAERPLEPTWETSGGDAEPAAASAASAAPSFSFDANSSGATARPAGSTPRLVTRPSPKRKPKNPMIEVVKVVGGGVAGLLIAQLILWWFPVKKYRRDPFDFGPKLAKVSWLKFVVPQEYWPGSDPEGPGPMGGGGFAPGLGPQNGASGGLGMQSGKSDVETPPAIDWNQVISQKPDDDAGKSKPAPGKPAKAKSKPAATPPDDLTLDDAPPKPNSSNDPLGDLKIDLASPVSKPAAPKPTVKQPDAEPSLDDDLNPPAKPTVKPTPSDPSDSPDAADAKKPTTASDERVKPAAATEADDPNALPLVTGKPVTAAEVDARAVASREAGMAWLNAGDADPDERRRLGASFYQGLARLAADAATPVADDADAARAAIEAVGRTTLSEPSFARAVEIVGRQRLAEAKSAGRGIALVGTVQADSDSASAQRLVIAMQGKQPQEAIVIVDAEAATNLKPGQRVFILGVVAKNPAEYRGEQDERPVVLSSTARIVALPAAPTEDAPASEPKKDDAKEAVKEPAKEAVKESANEAEPTKEP